MIPTKEQRWTWRDKFHYHRMREDSPVPQEMLIAGSALLNAVDDLEARLSRAIAVCHDVPATIYTPKAHLAAAGAVIKENEGTEAGRMALEIESKVTRQNMMGSLGGDDQ